MGPYDNAAMAQNFEMARSTDRAPDIDWPRYLGAGNYFTLTLNGREAISLAIADLGVAADDEILIVTTSGSSYVSGCVTQMISRYCRWSRHRSERTRAIFVIHEFGFPARLDDDLLESGLPIIEDCAYALGSQNEYGTVGRRGEYVIYSFAKAFPMAYGGLLI
jgi:perosamine synthetase